LELAAKYEGKDLHILVHQGSADTFLETQLSTAAFKAVLSSHPVLSNATVHIVEGYDHSYYFISTFIEEHVDHHAKYLKDV